MIDPEIRKRHIAKLQSENAITLYDQLCALVEEKHQGGCSVACQRLIGDIAGLEQLKEIAMTDILNNGVREQYRNGNQRGERENRAVSIYQRSIEGQRKLMAELRITPASAKSVVQDSFLDDGFAGF